MSKQNQTSPGGTPSGLIIINKHAGVTSHDIVNAVRRLFETRQVGHTGTLDPIAEGVLPILVGRAVKAAEYLTADDKHYTAHLKLGVTTDTEDIGGAVLSAIEDPRDLPAEAEVRRCINNFIGEIEQTPPMYSALKLRGQKLVDLARQGITVERQSRRVTVYSLDIQPLSNEAPCADYALRVHCSKGTYIRTLCADIGRALGCGAVMTALLRTRSGQFDLSQSVTVDKLQAMSLAERIACLLPTEALFANLPAVRLPDFYARLARCGAELYQTKIQTAFEVGQRVRLYDAGGFFALGEVRAYEKGSAVKPVKLFVL